MNQLIKLSWSTNDFLISRTEMAYCACGGNAPQISVIMDCLAEELEKDIVIIKDTINIGMLEMFKKAYRAAKDIDTIRAVLDMSRLPYKIDGRYYNLAQQTLFL